MIQDTKKHIWLCRKATKVRNYIEEYHNDKCIRCSGYSLYSGRNCLCSSLQNPISDGVILMAAKPAPVVTISDIDYMDGSDFEHYIADLLYTLGYTKVEVTPQSGDYGADVVAYHDGTKCVIQCKRHSKNCGQPPVREIFAAKAHYKAQRAIVVTNAYFSRAAQELAASTGVELWDRDVLSRMAHGKQVLRHPMKNRSSTPLWYILGIIFLPFYAIISLILQTAKKYK